MIVLISQNADNFANPTINLLLKGLKQKDKKVLVIAPNQLVKKPEYLTNVAEYFIDYFDPAIPKRPAPFISFSIFISKILIQIYKHRCKTVLAIDPFGLILATRLKFIKKNLEIHHLSFEILFGDSIANNQFYKYVKRKEIEYSRYLKSILIQDAKRKEHFISENKIELHNKLDWHFVAVASEPITSLTSENKIRKQYKLDNDIKLLLHTGTLAEWSGEQIYIDILERGLTENHILFLHSRYKLTSDQKLHAKLLDLERKGYPVILHDEYIDDPVEYHNFIKSFDYGLVLYLPNEGIYTGNNIKDIGLASGKFSYYMACGIPVLASKCETYEMLNNIYNFGVLIKDSLSASNALRNHSLDSIDPANCVRLYEEQLNPQKPMQEFINYLIDKN